MSRINVQKISSIRLSGGCLSWLPVLSLWWLATAVLFLFSIGACGIVAEPVPRELRALAFIHKVHDAEKAYFNANGKYGSLQDLGAEFDKASGHNEPKLINFGYRFEFSVTRTGYTIAAAPLQWNVTGRRSFYSDQSLVMRFTWGPEPQTL